MFDEETGMYRYGPRFYFEKETGKIFYFVLNVLSSVPYWEEMNPFEWPPFTQGGHTEDNTDVLILEYDPGFDPTSKPDRVDLETGEIIYVPWPQPEPQPEPEETELEVMRRELNETKEAVEDLTVTLVDFIMGGE